MTSLLDQIKGGDIDAFLDTESGFAEEATFTGTFGPYAVPIIFEPGEESIDPYNGEVDNVPPRALAKTSDVENAKHKDTVRINNITYEIVEAVPDGFGMTTLTLNKTRTD